MYLLLPYDNPGCVHLKSSRVRKKHWGLFDGCEHTSNKGVQLEVPKDEQTQDTVGRDQESDDGDEEVDYKGEELHNL